MRPLKGMDPLSCVFVILAEFLYLGFVFVNLPVVASVFVILVVLLSS